MWASENARKAEAMVARLLPNSGGPGLGKRQLLASVAKAKLAYAAPVWAKGMDVERNAKRARGALRTAAIRCIRGYRTISTEAAEVLASQIPGDLYIKMVAEQFWEARRTGDKAAAKAKAKEAALSRWQERWNRAQSWTRCLIRDLRSWLDRGHGELSFEITQIFSGHGSFESYRKKIGKDSDGLCNYCNVVEEDTARHVLTACRGWDEERNRMIMATGTVDPEKIVEIMIRDKMAWEAVAWFAKTVMSKKYRDELESRQEQP